MPTATKVRDMKRSGSGAARALYRLDPPLSGEGDSYEYVVVSAVIAPHSGAETYIFGANQKGDVVEWSELPGSYRGGLDHQAALIGAGYEVA